MNVRERKLKVAIVLGTRPEIIKCSSVIKTLDKRGHKWNVIHTNQHYDENMDANFIDELEIPKENIIRRTNDFNVGTVIHSLIGLLKGYDVVLVQGDTNSVLCGAIAARLNKIPIGHIEAGIRSYDTRLMEECNRQMVGRISSFNFCPTDTAVINLEKENIPSDRNYVTGNTIVDAVNYYSNNHKDWKRELIGDEVKYALLTMHRAELVDNTPLLSKMLSVINLISKKYNVNIVYPIHPRTKKMLDNFKIDIHKEIDNLILVEPTSFVETLSLQKNAEFIITDSGGIQEESCILNKPCITIRDSTERPETIGLNNILLKPSEINDYLFERKEVIVPEIKEYYNPFGDGNAANNIVDILEMELINKNETKDL